MSDATCLTYMPIDIVTEAALFSAPSYGSRWLYSYCRRFVRDAG